MVKMMFVLLGALGTVWLRQGNPTLNHEISIITQDPDVEFYLSKFEKEIGDDMAGYRGHIYRVLTYSNHFLHGDESKLRIVAAALVYHDIGLWTDNILSYLEPGCARAKEEFENSLSKEDLRLLDDIIYYHHKVTPFEGPNADVVNAVRRGDWIDATLGFINHGMPQAHISLVNNQIPNAGFHKCLANFGPKLYGWDILRIVTELSSIMKW